MTSRIPPDVAQRVAALVESGAYPSPDEVLRDAIVALDERRQDADSIGTAAMNPSMKAKKTKRIGGRDRALEKWLAGFDAWVSSHRPVGHFVDDSRDSIYE